jgi:hypothetical protein
LTIKWKTGGGNTTAGLLGVPETADLRAEKKRWVEETLGRPPQGRESSWSEDRAVGDEELVGGVKKALGPRCTIKR